ncbi:hypothetical protein [Planctomicrobium piriforme]|uniref:Uncharacterized protein n=1 Tax=Planctomicrobium piriforme TaxID=1576369 RepID=A0A1I3THS5_9PLAN|nr:hypothetical protein [Planctomicrobium piriforme]SFJ70784.1 hypothetical protein SAMN05421753_1317 [Planctomicrobium piriforme]
MELDELGKCDWSEAAADAWFVRAKIRGDQVGKNKCGKGCKVVDIVHSQGTPLGIHLAAANRSEVKLIESPCWMNVETLQNRDAIKSAIGSSWGGPT